MSPMGENKHKDSTYRVTTPPGDLLWDGSGIGNCWSDNKFNSSFPELLPTCK